MGWIMRAFQAGSTVVTAKSETINEDARSLRQPAAEPASVVWLQFLTSRKNRLPVGDEMLMVLVVPSLEML